MIRIIKNYIRFENEILSYNLFVIIMCYSISSSTFSSMVRLSSQNCNKNFQNEYDSSNIKYGRWRDQKLYIYFSNVIKVVFDYLFIRRSMWLWQYIPCGIWSKHGGGERRTFQRRRGVRRLFSRNLQLQSRP